jgi:probable F420-dependent oxidoreductase
MIIVTEGRCLVPNSGIATFSSHVAGTAYHGPVSRPFRFAVQGAPFRDPEALAARARTIESLGYDELYSADHIGGIDPFAPLVAAALATERLRVGPLVINNELHHPVLLARTAATVDLVTGGRLVLGLGTGYDESEHEAIGSPIRPPGPRVERFGESLAILRSLLDTDGAHLDGRHERVDLDELGVRPAQAHVPILVGGHGRRVVELAGRFADIFQFTGLVHGDGGRPTSAGFALADVAERGRWLDEAADGRRIERSALVQFVAVGDDAPSAGDLAGRFDLDEDVVGTTPFVLSGSVAQLVDRIGQLRDEIGVSHFVVRDPEAFAPIVDQLAGR